MPWSPYVLRPWWIRVHTRASLFLPSVEPQNIHTECVLGCLSRQGKRNQGEFGMESYNCRLICCWIYILALIGDIEGTLDMGRLIYHVPTKAESWITYEV